MLFFEGVFLFEFSLLDILYVVLFEVLVLLRRFKKKVICYSVFYGFYLNLFKIIDC